MSRHAPHPTPPPVGHGARNGARPEAGFSLIEMIVALALLAGMLALLPGTLRLGAHAWRAQHGIDRSAAIAAARRVISVHVAQAMPLHRHRDGRAKGLDFEGDATSLRFVAPAPQAAPASGLVTYRLLLSDGPRPPAEASSAPSARRHMTVTTAPLGDDVAAAGDGAPPTATSILLEDVADLRLRYFGRPADGSARPRWHTEWRRRARLPDLIEVSFDIASPSGPRTERLVVATQLGGGR